MITLSQLSQAPTGPQSSAPTQDYSKMTWDQAVGPKPSVPQQPGIGQQVGSHASNTAQQIGSDINTTGQGIQNTLADQSKPVIQRGFEATDQALGAIPKVVTDLIPNGSIAKVGLDKTSQAIGDTINWLGEKIGSTELAKNLVMNHPAVTKLIQDTAGILKPAGDISGNILAIGGATEAGNKIASNVKTGIMGSEPTITVGGKTFTADQLHTGESADHFKTLSPADQTAVANFDHEQSLNSALDTATAKGDTETATMIKQQLDSLKNNSTDVKGSTATVNPGTSGLVGTIKDAFKPEETAPINTSEQVAADAIKNPLTAKEQATAAGQGRATVNGLNKKIDYNPDQQTINMQNALKPLADEGKIVSPKSPEDHLGNIVNTQEAIDTRGTEIRTALKNSNATWNANELKGNLESVNVPDPVKNEPAMARNATSLKNAAVKIASDATKSPDGILDLRQNFDQYIKDNYGKNFFAKGRNVDPWHSYVYSLRDTMNNMAEYKLPEGKLPDGTSYGDALKNQSNLISAKEEMQTKFAREFPEGTTITSRFMKDHPYIKRFGLRAGMTIAAGALGITALSSLIRKTVSGK